MDGITIQRFEDSDETRVFDLGRFYLIRAGGMTIGRAEYEPGWRWSEHVGKAIGQSLCPTPHLGLVVSGRNRVEMADGTLSISGQATSSTSARGTTAGCWVRSHTSRSTSWVRRPTPPADPGQASSTSGASPG